MKLYVGNIERTVSEDELKDLFQNHGNIESITIIKDRFTNESRGFGFVSYAAAEEAKNAMKALDGHVLKGRSLKVNEAQEREERPRSAGGGGFGGGASRGGAGGGFGGPRRDDSRSSGGGFGGPRRSNSNFNR